MWVDRYLHFYIEYGNTVILRTNKLSVLNRTSAGQDRFTTKNFIKSNLKAATFVSII